MAEEEARARSSTSRRTHARTEHATDTDPSAVRAPISHAGAMAHRSSRTYLRRLCRRHTDTGYLEVESEAAAKLQDDDEA